MRWSEGIFDLGWPRTRFLDAARVLWKTFGHGLLRMVVHTAQEAARDMLHALGGGSVLS